MDLLYPVTLHSLCASMTISSAASATLSTTTPQQIILAGAWTASGIGALEKSLDEIAPKAGAVVNGSEIDALDSAGAWILQRFLKRLGGESEILQVQEMIPNFARLLKEAGQQAADTKPAIPEAPTSIAATFGQKVVAGFEQAYALFSFVGECAVVFAGSVRHPSRIRWRPILFNIRSAGFDALPIVGLLSFLLGIVVAYQGADQLKQYGANIFVADLIGLSMLREFAPLITAIIIAGRSGSAYAAQIGSMSVSEEIAAMRTLGIAPLELLVLPKIIALAIALPLLTVFADVMGVLGGMLMAGSQLDVGFVEFFDRFVKAVSVTSYLIGICKAPVFAAIIVIVGCFQGFRTQGGADNVGRQTTRSVLQSIFLVISADALFSVAFSALDM
jgi:phospholipid/cholesterol/gamma-HCH transport system permease protein